MNTPNAAARALRAERDCLRRRAQEMNGTIAHHRRDVAAAEAEVTVRRAKLDDVIAEQAGVMHEAEQVEAAYKAAFGEAMP